jgi:hypothetical protein
MKLKFKKKKNEKKNILPFILGVCDIRFVSPVHYQFLLLSYTTTPVIFLILYIFLLGCLCCMAFLWLTPTSLHPSGVRRGKPPKNSGAPPILHFQTHKPTKGTDDETRACCFHLSSKLFLTN